MIQYARLHAVPGILLDSTNGACDKIQLVTYTFVRENGVEFH